MRDMQGLRSPHHSKEVLNMRLVTLLNQTADAAYRRFLGEDNPPIPTWLPPTRDTLTREVYSNHSIEQIEASLHSFEVFRAMHDSYASPKRVTPAPVEAPQTGDAVLLAKIAETQAILDTLIEGLNPPVEVPATAPPIEAVTPTYIAPRAVQEAMTPPVELPRCSDLTNDQAWSLLGGNPKMRAKTAKRRQGTPSERQKYRLKRHGLAV